MISYNMMLALLAAMFAATFVVIGCFLLILKPWVKPMRRTWQNSQDVMAEHLLVSAADARRQAAEEENKAMQAAITAEQTRTRLIEARAENDQTEIESKKATKEAAIEAKIAAENTRLRLIQARAEADRAEIERRQSLEEAGIDLDAPPPPKPKTWVGKHKFWILFTLFWIIMIIVAMLYDKGVIK